MKQEEVERKAKEIEEIYTNFEKELAGLERERNKVLSDFLQEVEKEKIAKLKNKLS